MSDDMVVLPGERCRKAREAQGMTQAQAAQRLHLSLTYLQSLDADDYERLPEATFVKGYLRNYARLLGLPADEIANTFQQMVNDDVLDKPLQLPSIAPPPSAWRKPVLIAGAGGAGGVVVGVLACQRRITGVAGKSTGDRAGW